MECIMEWKDHNTQNTPLPYYIKGPGTNDFPKAFDWCTEHKSTGMFYTAPLGNWWFEHEDDALLFALKWSA